MNKFKLLLASSFFLMHCAAIATEDSTGGDDKKKIDSPAPPDGRCAEAAADRDHWGADS